MFRGAAWGNRPLPQSVTEMYKQNCVSNPVHLKYVRYFHMQLAVTSLPQPTRTIQAAAWHLVPPPQVPRQQGAAASGSTETPTKPHRNQPRTQKQGKKCPRTSASCCAQCLGINFSCLQRCCQRKSTWLQGGQSWLCASHLQRELLPAAPMS